MLELRKNTAHYTHRESYKHLFAKQLLVCWLRELDEKQDACSFGELYWRSNWGVHEELPFYEKDNPYYFEMSAGLKENAYDSFGTKHYNHQDFFYPYADRGKLLFIPDITIFHKGAAKILIEVIHKSHPTEEKVKLIMDFFDKKEGSGIEMFSVSADHILGQIGKPKQLNFNIII